MEKIKKTFNCQQCKLILVKKILKIILLEIKFKLKCCLEEIVCSDYGVLFFFKCKNLHYVVVESKLYNQ